MQRRRPFRSRRSRSPRPQGCFFCKAGIVAIDYKDITRLQKFITRRGKIVGRDESGVCAKHQRTLGQAIKKARIVALLPFTDRHAL